MGFFGDDFSLTQVDVGYNVYSKNVFDLTPILKVLRVIIFQEQRCWFCSSMPLLIETMIIYGKYRVEECCEKFKKNGDTTYSLSKSSSFNLSRRTLAVEITVQMTLIFATKIDAARWLYLHAL